MVLPEIVAVGIYNSAVSVKNRSGSTMNALQNRKTTMIELELPIETGGMSYIDTDQTPITTDTVICAKPGQIRHTRLPFKCYYIHMILESGELFDILINTPTFLMTERAEDYRRIFEQLCEYEKSALQIDKIKLHSLILDLVHMLARDSRRQNSRVGEGYSNREVIEKVIRYIKSNLDSDLSLEAVSAYANLSTIHFHNCFKSATGRTLHDYVEEKRIKRAMDLLLTTDMTLTEIAFACGFSSQSYFSYVFKRRMKMTPREYAKTINSRYDI